MSEAHWIPLAIVVALSLFPCYHRCRWGTWAFWRQVHLPPAIVECGECGNDMMTYEPVIEGSIHRYMCEYCEV